MQNLETMTYNNTHVLFAKLPIEAKALFYFQSMAAWEYYCNWPHTSAEIYGDLERIWNAERLTPEDLRNWCRMSELLETELGKCVEQQRRSKGPKAKLRDRRNK